MTKVSGRISVSDGDARTLARAIGPDDTESMATRVEDGVLRVEFEYDDIARAINSLDDILSCLGTAKEVEECV